MRIAWLWLWVGGVGFCPIAVGSRVALGDEALDKTLQHRNDGYVIDLTVLRQGKSKTVSTARKDQKTSSTETQWTFAPTHVRVHVLPLLNHSMVWNADKSMYLLEQWEQQIDQELARIQQVRLIPKNPMLAFVDEDERVIRAADARLEDVKALLRLLHGIEEYQHIGATAGGTGQPVSRAPELSFGGGKLITTFRDYSGEARSDQQDYPPWNAQTVPGLAIDAAKRIELIVWQFDPNDMVRARALMADLGNITKDLTYNGDNVRTDLIDKRVNLDWKTFAQISHARFRDAFIGALEDVARYAWTLAPKEPPAGLFAQGPRAQLWLGTLTPDAPLSLPEVSGNRLMRLVMPAGGLNRKHLAVMGGDWIDSTRTDFTWYYEFPPQPFSVERSQTVVMEGTASPNSEHNTFMKNGVNALIDAEFSDDQATGTLMQSAAHNATGEALGNVGMVDIVEHADDEVSVEWSVTYEPAPASPEDEPMVLSFARPFEGKAIPFDASEIDYGEGFYVEGRLEKPATRKVYRVKMDVAAGPPHEVFLRPVEGNPMLVRSDVLYVMWDVTKQGVQP
jgi:hypothetical protein